MRFLLHLVPALLLPCHVLADKTNRQALTYAALPEDMYAPSANASITTLSNFIKSRSDLSILAKIVAECGGKSCLSYRPSILHRYDQDMFMI
jgi:hypothetical protein